MSAGPSGMLSVVVVTSDAKKAVSPLSAASNAAATRSATLSQEHILRTRRAAATRSYSLSGSVIAWMIRSANRSRPPPAQSSGDVVLRTM